MMILRSKFFRDYISSGKSTHEIAIEYNIAKSTVSQWVKQYHDECQYTTPEEAGSATEIRKLNQRIKEQEIGEPVDQKAYRELQVPNVAPSELAEQKRYRLKKTEKCLWEQISGLCPLFSSKGYAAIVARHNADFNLSGTESECGIRLWAIGKALRIPTYHLSAIKSHLMLITPFRYNKNVQFILLVRRYR